MVVILRDLPVILSEAKDPSVAQAVMLRSLRSLRMTPVAHRMTAGGTT
jgi:hypothetical protein